MKVIAVGGVVIRPQDNTERLAGAIAHLTQKLRVLILLRPVLEHADAATIGQTKTGNIQRIGTGVATERAAFAVVDIATGEAAEVINPRDLCP